MLNEKEEIKRLINNYKKYFDSIKHIKYGKRTFSLNRIKNRNEIFNFKINVNNCSQFYDFIYYINDDQLSFRCYIPYKRYYSYERIPRFGIKLFLKYLVIFEELLIREKLLQC